MKPILFNAEMVRATLDERKTVTRRGVKPQPEGKPYKMPDGSCWPGYFGTAESNKVFAPPYQPGDILYVRETWTKLYYADPDGYTHFEKPMYFYAADGTPDITLYNADGFEESDQRIRWHPSIHMPKEAARIFLRVTNVGVERLQDISDEDVEKEGFDGVFFEGQESDRGFAMLRFAKVWDSTIKKTDLDQYGWAANPWVWVIFFEKISREEALQP